MTDNLAKPKRISKKIMAAISTMVHDGATITAAAAQAGLSREHLSRELRKPHIAKELQDKTLAHLSINAAKAGATKVALLDSGNELVRDRASSFILGVAGISPANAPGNPMSQPRAPGLQIVIYAKSGDAQIVASPSGPHEPRLIEHEPMQLPAICD